MHEQKYCISNLITAAPFCSLLSGLGAARGSPHAAALQGGPSCLLVSVLGRQGNHRKKNDISGE